MPINPDRGWGATTEGFPMEATRAEFWISGERQVVEQPAWAMQVVQCGWGQRAGSTKRRWGWKGSC